MYHVTDAQKNVMDTVGRSDKAEERAKEFCARFKQTTCVLQGGCELARFLYEDGEVVRAIPAQKRR